MPGRCSRSHLAPPRISLGRHNRAKKRRKKEKKLSPGGISRAELAHMTRAWPMLTKSENRDSIFQSQRRVKCPLKKKKKKFQKLAKTRTEFITGPSSFRSNPVPLPVPFWNKKEQDPSPLFIRHFTFTTKSRKFSIVTISAMQPARHNFPLLFDETAIRGFFLASNKSKAPLNCEFANPLLRSAQQIF